MLELKRETPFIGMTEVEGIFDYDNHPHSPYLVSFTLPDRQLSISLCVVYKCKNHSTE